MDEKDGVQESVNTIEDLREELKILREQIARSSSQQIQTPPPCPAVIYVGEFAAIGCGLPAGHFSSGQKHSVTMQWTADVEHLSRKA